MTEVMLKPSAQSTVFRRTLRDQDGKELSTLEFYPGKPLSVTADVLKFLEPDLGHALVEVRRDADGTIRVKHPGAEESKPEPSDETVYDMKPAKAEDKAEGGRPNADEAKHGKAEHTPEVKKTHKPHK